MHAIQGERCYRMNASKAYQNPYTPMSDAFIRAYKCSSCLSACLRFGKAIREYYTDAQMLKYTHFLCRFMASDICQHETGKQSRSTEPIFVAV